MSREMEGIDWTTIAEQLLGHWKRSGITHLPIARHPLPDEIAQWSVADRKNESASGSIKASTVQPSPAKEPPPPPKQASPASPPPTKPKAPLPPVESPTTLTPWTNASLDDNQRAVALQGLHEEVKACRKCADIVCRRMQTVFGIGPLRPKLVMFGEAPGADEDRIGEPFVGAAGQLLDKILSASGLSRQQVYIMNALKCRPPGNRTPVDAEIDNCRPFFESQLEILQPEYIICWGSVAARAVLRRNDSIGRLRGRFYAYKNAKVMVTYHPAYLLRTPEAKHQTWEDMKMLMRELGITLPTR
jgi:uracil-DNA glycosylase family 4